MPNKKNTIVQNPNTVGTALKTLSLRIRGVKTELEEAGLEVEGMAETTSQLQAKLLALTDGKVNIMADANNFKNTTQILREMAAEWEHMTDVEQAAALELLGGKRQANTLSAVISNFDIVEDAIEASANSAGSALEENEKVLDSIQGRINLFNNALQTFWNNLLSSDLIKTVVSWGTQIVKSLDTTQGKLLAIVKAVALLMAYKKINPLDWVAKFVDITKAIKTDGLKNYIMSLFQVSAAQKTVTADTLVSTIAQEQNDIATQKQIVSKLGLTNVTGALTAAQKLQAAQELVTLFNGGMISKDLAARIAAMLGYKFSVDKTNQATVALDTTTKSFMATNPVGWILSIVSVVMTLVTSIKFLVDQTQDATEAAQEALSTYKNAQETLKSHKKTIEDIRKDYAELADGVDQLGNNVSLTSEEYERYNDIANQIADMFPQMVSGYTAEGNAIIALKGNVEELTKAYEEEARAANQAILAKSNDVFDNFKTTVDNDARISWDNTGLVQQQKLAEEIINLIQTGSEEEINDAWSKLNATNYQIDGQTYSNIEKKALFKAAGIDESEFRSIWDGSIDISSLKKQEAKLLAYLNTLSAKINAEVSNVKPIVTAYLENDLEYAKLSNKAQDSVQRIVGMLDAEFYSQFDNATDLQAYVTKNIVKPLQNANTSANFEAAFDLQTKFNQGEVSVQEYEDMVDGIVELIKGLGLDNADSIIKSIRLVFDVNDLGVIDSSTQEVAKSLLNESDYNKIKTLTKSELDIINQYASEWSQNAKWNGESWEIGKPILMSWDELIKKIEKAKSIKDDRKTSDSIESLVGIKDKLSSLGGAFDEFKEDGKVSINTLSDLNDKFSHLDGFEEFINVLGNSASTSEQVEQAISDMASAYLATTDILSDVTDENYAFIVSQLKALGVTNPEEYLNNLKSVHNAMAEQYGVDLSNYGTVEQMKQAISGDLYSILLGMEDMTMAELASKYGDDLYNYASLEEAKTEAARREALKRQEILKGENTAAGLENAEGWLNSQTVGDGDIKTSRWFDGDLEGKTYSEVKDLYKNGGYNDKNRANIKAWLDDVEISYNAMVQKSSNSAQSAYEKAVENINKSTEQFNSIDDYVAQYKLKLKVDVPKLGGDYDPLKEVEDGWDKLVSKYDNKLALITNERDLIEAEIDEAEARGSKASSQYYDDLIRNANEEKALLQDKYDALKAYLDANENAIDPDTWTEYNNELNEIAVSIKECEINTIEWAEAIREIDIHYFEQTMDAVSQLGEEIDFVNSLLEDEKVADENGNWSSAALTRIGLYTQQMEQAAAKAKLYQDEIDKLNTQYQNGELSEEQYQKRLAELVSGQRDAINSYEDAKDGIIELNEARIDAIKNGIEKEIEAYEDYIDMVKEALDAERDLYDFKKNIQKQTKDIASLERRIAALSGSTNAADIAERRKLEAELLEAKEGLNDTYYEHSRDAQSNALDDEAEAFSKSKEQYIKELESTLDDVEGLITQSIMDVLLNADTIYKELTGEDGITQKYGDILSAQLTQPWKDASDQATAWKKELEEKMSGSGEYAALIGEGGTITAFANGIATKLEGPWDSAEEAASDYFDFLTAEELGTNFGATITGFGTQIQSLVTYWDNVKKAAEAAHAEQERKVNVGGNPNVGDGNGGDDKKTPTYNPSDGVSMPSLDVKNLQEILNTVFKEKLSIDGDYGPATTAAVKRAQKTIGATADGYYGPDTKAKMESYIRNKWQANNGSASYIGEAIRLMLNKLPTSYYAKGTLGTSRDEWALTDEIGDELVLVPGENGNLSFMRKGTSVVPADITANLVEWGKLNPDMLNIANPTAGINMISNAVNKPELNITFDSLIKAENITEETLPAVKKLVTQELNRFTKELNYALKGKGAR